MEHSFAALPAFLVAQRTPFCGKTVISGWVERLKSQTLKEWKFQEYLINFAFVFLLHLLNAKQWCVISFIKIISEVLYSHKTNSKWWLWQGDIAEQWESDGLSKRPWIHWNCTLVMEVWWGFPGGSEVEGSTAVQETWAQSLAWEGPLEEGLATHCSILARENPTDRGVWWATVHRVTKNRTWLKQLSMLYVSALTLWFFF